jgi:uracil-DNA glycosylase
VNAESTLASIANKITLCKNCELSRTRKNAVPGSGPFDANIMLIGEGPGFHEDNQGLPFVGASGKFLTQLLNDGGVPRESVFITNVVKCRPPENRDPQPKELQACSVFLEEQITAINPMIIVTLGRFSMARYFEKARIGTIHGQAKLHNGRLIVPMYHPAAALHQPKLRSVIMEDFSRLKGMIDKEKERILALTDKTNTESDGSQPSLF